MGQQLTSGFSFTRRQVHHTRESFYFLRYFCCCCFFSVVISVCIKIHAKIMWSRDKLHHWARHAGTVWRSSPGRHALCRPPQVTKYFSSALIRMALGWTRAPIGRKYLNDFFSHLYRTKFTSISQRLVSADKCSAVKSACTVAVFLALLEKKRNEAFVV